VPMLREGKPIGTINVHKGDPEPFSESQIALLQTFAAQAVIAIENVRLFTELQQKNGALTQAHAQVSEALEQQTATAEILRVISSSPTDGQPVFDVIVESACRLCDAVFANAVQFDGELMHNMAHYGFSPEGLDILMRAFPRAPTGESMSGRAILDGAVVQSEDMSTDEGTALSHQLSRVLGSHAYLSVASNQARLHRITTDSNDWDRLCGLLHSQDGRRSPRHDDVDVETDEFGDERAICSWLGRYPVFEDDILGWDVTVFA